MKFGTQPKAGLTFGTGLKVMKLTILLQTRKGDYVHHFVDDFKSIACLSDAGQQMPRRVYTYKGDIFGYHRLTNEDAVIFKKIEVEEAK